MLLVLRVLFIAISIAISAFGIWFAYKTFPKRGRIFKMIVVALILGSIHEILIHVRVLSIGNPFMLISSLVLSDICYFYLFFVVNELYVLRLRSLGCRVVVKYESLTKYVPYFILLVAVCVQVEFAAFAFIPGIMEVSVYVGISIWLFAVALVLEIYLCVILIQKVLMMLEYRVETQRKTILKTKLYLVIIVGLELSIFLIRIFYFDSNSPEGHIRILGFLVRILIVIDFYNDIIMSITSDDDDDGRMMKKFCLVEDSGVSKSDSSRKLCISRSLSFP